MPWFENIANFACECMFYLGNVLANTAIRVTDFIEKARGAIRSDAAQQQDTQRKLHDINLSIEDFLRKKNRDRGLSLQDQNRLNELKSKREQLKRDVWSAKEQETLRTVTQKTESVRSVIITPQPQHLHIVQYHVGQTVTGKRCPVPGCGKDMMLRINDQNGNPFWGCVGYFDNSQCNGSEAYRQNDGQLFTPTEIREFEVSSDDLRLIFSNQQVQVGVAGRMRQHQGTSTENYLCPEHSEPLVLREKREFHGALDQFFLSCPHWHGRDAVSCNYIVKIKTPAQLAAVLKHYEGRGIL